MRRIICITLSMMLLVFVMAVSANIACAAAGIKVGDVIQFGAYSWRVLDIQNGKALMLSDGIIEQRAYNEVRADVTWRTCTLRQYLNGEFYNNEFLAEEKARIAETRIFNDNNPWYGTSGGDAIIDKIFLLSVEEVVRYFGDSGDLKNRKGWYWENGNFILKDGRGHLINDEYNSARIAVNAYGAVSWWWLRSPGNFSNNAAFVDYDGSIDFSGYPVLLDGGGIRPALWLNL